MTRSSDSIQLLFLLILIGQASIMNAQDHTHVQGRVIDFPNVPGYLTLSTDLHQHTVFSDGYVWPSIRIMEAARDSIDVISMTEHLEYQPFLEDIPNPDRNRSFQLSTQYAKPYDIMVLHGAEMTRDYPPGHTNAIFINDANKISQEDSRKGFQEAKDQGAFIFWNHPDWFRDAKDAVAKITDLHLEFIAENQLHGIEVVNEITYSKEAFQLALDHDLTIMGTSDIHGLIDWQFGIGKGGHRPVTLVFAKEKTPASVKEALFDKRTVVYFNDMLIGREEHMMPLLESCIQVNKSEYMGATTVLEVEVENKSNALLILANESEYGFRTNGSLIMLRPKEKQTWQVKTIVDKPVVDMELKILNAVVRPEVHPTIKLRLRG